MKLNSDESEYIRFDWHQPGNTKRSRCETFPNGNQTPGGRTGGRADGADRGTDEVTGNDRPRQSKTSAELA